MLTVDIVSRIDMYSADAPQLLPSGDEISLSRYDSFIDDQITEASDFARQKKILDCSTFFKGCTFTTPTSLNYRPLSLSNNPFTAPSSSTYLHRFLPSDHYRLNIEHEANTSHPRRLSLWLIDPEPIPKHVQVHYWIKSTVKEADTVDVVKRIDDKEAERLAYI